MPCSRQPASSKRQPKEDRTMRTRSRLLFAALAATMLMSFAASSASARRFEVSERHFLAIWTSLEFVLGGNAILCPVTLEGSFHSRTLSKVSGQLVGYISNAVVNSPLCTNGTATVLPTSLPWHLRYDSFRGTLPSITGVLLQLIRASFRIADTVGFSCLAETKATEPAHGIVEVTAGVARTLRADELKEINCPFLGRGRFRGTAEVFVQNAPGLETTRITVRLVQ
jgi:hypothetical protein